jgi:hypothetical protein
LFQFVVFPRTIGILICVYDMSVHTDALVLCSLSYMT